MRRKTLVLLHAVDNHGSYFRRARQYLLYNLLLNWRYLRPAELLDGVRVVRFEHLQLFQQECSVFQKLLIELAMCATIVHAVVFTVLNDGTLVSALL